MSGAKVEHKCDTCIFVIYVVLTPSGLRRGAYQQNDGLNTVENMSSGTARPQKPLYIDNDILGATTRERTVQLVMDMNSEKRIVDGRTIECATRV